MSLIIFLSFPFHSIPFFSFLFPLFFFFFSIQLHRRFLHIKNIHCSSTQKNLVFSSSFSLFYICFLHLRTYIITYWISIYVWCLKNRWFTTIKIVIDYYYYYYYYYHYHYHYCVLCQVGKPCWLVGEHGKYWQNRP